MSTKTSQTRFSRLAAWFGHRSSQFEPATLTLPLANRHFVLDGTNIALLHGPARPELRYVVALSSHLVSNGGKVSCFFDANTPYIFSDARSEQRECFNRLTSEAPWAKDFVIVPGGTQADQWILELAKRENADVISNDRFKDRARSHRWIYKRRHGICIREGRLALSSLDANIELLAQPEDYLSLKP
ncbi:hypothetical protein R0135_04310 [Congregibacter variabilis]|uniref:RNase NYN domain-containing protein n=1 Tax=Congregibacter variabilis TaxID=3081200 RepID=A0ABZ0I5F6_9GAMM|nr:hypothetical protein R0135_04310 [Congregibacter sp. IMCC43200]